MKSISLLCVFLFFPVASHAYNYAKDWLRYPQYARSMYIEGFTDGYLQGCANGMEFYKDGKQNPSYKVCLEQIGKPASSNNEEIQMMADAYYGAPENSKIPFTIIIQAAIERLSGKTTEEIEASLLECRKRF